MNPVDVRDLLVLLYELLGNRFGVAPDRFTVSVAGDLAQVVELLADAPNSARLVISDEGDEPANPENPENGIVRQTIAVYVAMAAGLPAQMKAGAWLGKPGKPALLTKCAEVRDFVRGLEFPDDLTNGRPDYAGRQAVLDRDGAPLHAYRLAFAFYTALPEPTATTVAV